MNIFVQDKYLQSFKENISNLIVSEFGSNSETSARFKFNFHLDNKERSHFDVIFCELDYFNMHSLMTSRYKYFLVPAEMDSLHINEIADFLPTGLYEVSDQFKAAQDFIGLLKKVNDLQGNYNFKKNEIGLVEDAIEKLRNEILEKNEAVNFFINEENLKKNKEKKLLYFLDFLNMEHDKSDFLDSLCKLLWVDLKKVGLFNLLGFYVQTHSSESVMICYDGRNIKFYHDILFLGDKVEQRKSLSQILQRPVVSLNTWVSHKDGVQNIFFLERSLSDYSEEKLNSYVLERIDLMILMIQRHMSRLQALYLLNKWNVFGKAYKFPMHVVDGQYNLIQSNYFPQQRSTDTRTTKCYEKLAYRSSPCEECPVNMSNNQYVLIKGRKYKTHTTDFFIDQKYHLIFYDDMTEADLLKSKVIQNEKMSAIGQLANHLAHELNNPLTGLKLATEIVLEEEYIASSPIRSDLLEILKGVDRCQMIISDLLNYSSDQGPELMLGTIGDVVKKTMPLLKSITRDHSIFIDTKPVNVQMNVAQLQQVVFNLIKNSCQAVGEKGIVKIYDIESDAFYDVVFEDNGVGLPQNVKSTLFQPFSTTKEVGEGTGLGLYISKNIVQRMNADLLYDDTYKSGTRFILRFKK